MDELNEDGVRVERGAKRVRALLAGRVVADTTRPLLVWEVPYYPAYYLPESDVALDALPEGAVSRHPGPPQQLRAHVKLDWDAMDAWFEEDEEVFVHPRDPYTRVDILPSARHVRVEVNGETVAESRRPWLLFETGLRTRYYLPKTDVRLDLLEPSDTVTRCPYKGESRYWSVRAGGELVRDLAWSYPTPLPESERIAGLVCFTDERVDVHVDGVPQPRPKTTFA